MNKIIHFQDFLVGELEDFFEESQGIKRADLGCLIYGWSEFVQSRQYAIYHSGFRFLTSLADFNLYFEIFFPERDQERHHDHISSLAAEAVEWYGVKIIEYMYEEDKTVGDSVREFCGKVYIDTYLPSKAH